MKLVGRESFTVLDDTVYLDGEKELQEYVMNEVGLIWKNLERSTPWEYSQFQEDILDCALYLMNDVGMTPATSRNDPVYICRVLSATVRKLFFFNKKKPLFDCLIQILIQLLHLSSLLNF